jgi:hypothetical protein
MVNETIEVFFRLGPLHVNVVYETKIKRICSNEQTTKTRLRELTYHLKKRGYNNASINHCFNTASGTEKTSSNIKKRRRTTECHLSSHTILCLSQTVGFHESQDG